MQGFDIERRKAQGNSQVKNIPKKRSHQKLRHISAKASDKQIRASNDEQSNIEPMPFSEIYEEQLFEMASYVFTNGNTRNRNTELCNKTSYLSAVGYFRLKSVDGKVLLRETVDKITEKYEKLLEIAKEKAKRQQMQAEAQQRLAAAINSESTTNAIQTGANLVQAFGMAQHAAASMEAAHALGETANALESLSALLEGL